MQRRLPEWMTRASGVSAAELPSGEDDGTEPRGYLDATLRRKAGEIVAGLVSTSTGEVEGEIVETPAVPLLQLGPVGHMMLQGEVEESSTLDV